MNLLSFDSPEEMQAYLRSASASAHSHLHLAQETIGFGDTWLQFVDLVQRHIVFGRVQTLDEVMAGEIESGATHSAAEVACRDTDWMLAKGYMYGRAYDYMNPEGELGHTHKAHAWPIEPECFYAAREVGWHIDKMPLSQKINLEVAFRAWKGHVRGGH